MSIPAALLLAALSAGPAPTPAPRPPPPQRERQARTLPTPALPVVEGQIGAVDRTAHRLEVTSPSGRVALSFDRNTIFLTPAGAGTPLDLKEGGSVRVGLDGASRAAWVEVRAAPAPTRPQGGAAGSTLQGSP